MTLRLPLRINGVRRGAQVHITFDDVDVVAHDGEMLASALLASGVRMLRRAPVDGAPRGLFCAMGSCQECVVLIGERRIESCRIPVREGLQARSLR